VAGLTLVVGSVLVAAACHLTAGWRKPVSIRWQPRRTHFVGSWHLSSHRCWAVSSSAAALMAWKSALLSFPGRILGCFVVFPGAKKKKKGRKYWFERKCWLEPHWGQGVIKTLSAGLCLSAKQVLGEWKARGFPALVQQKMQLVLLHLKCLSYGRNQCVCWAPSWASALSSSGAWHPHLPGQRWVLGEGWWKAAWKCWAGEASFPCWDSRAESSAEAGAAATDVARMMDKPQRPAKPAVECLLTSGSLSHSLGTNKWEGAELSGSSRDVQRVCRSLCSALALPGRTTADFSSIHGDAAAWSCLWLEQLLLAHRCFWPGEEEAEEGCAPHVCSASKQSLQPPGLLGQNFPLHWELWIPSPTLD